VDGIGGKVGAMSKDLQQTMAKVGRSIAKRESDKVHQFPLWPDPKRGIPNDFARSALFAARKGVSDKYLQRVSVFSQGGISITYSGPQLTQDHLDVFEGVMHFARGMPESEHVQFTAAGLLKLIGRGASGSDYERLTQSFICLSSATVEINHVKGAGYWGSLLPSGSRDGDLYSIKVDRNLIRYFEKGFTLTQHEQRKQLARSPLAKHLQCWLSSHEQPYPTSVEYLHKLTGSETKELYKFRQMLRKALAKLVDVDVLDDWFIDEADKVHFVKAVDLSTS